MREVPERFYPARQSDGPASLEAFRLRQLSAVKVEITFVTLAKLLPHCDRERGHRNGKGIIRCAWRPSETHSSVRTLIVQPSATARRLPRAHATASSHDAHRRRAPPHRRDVISVPGQTKKNSSEDIVFRVAPRKADIVRSVGMSRRCHLWTAPAVEEESDISAKRCSHVSRL